MDELEALKEKNIAEKTQADLLAKREIELRAELLKIADEKRTLTESIFDRSREIRILTQARQAEEQRRLLAEAARKAEEERNSSRAALIEKAKQFPWYEDLYKHQKEGVLFLASAKRAICADSMGLGKTLEAAAALDLMGAKKVLIICPGDVMSNFYNTFKKWAPHRKAVVIGRRTKAEQKIFLENFAAAADEYTFIVNYESWNRNRKLLDWLQAARFDTIVIDEAHTIKETDTVAYQGVYYLAKNKQAPVENFLALTGTPILNKPSELYPLLHICNDELFPSRMAFRQSFVETTANNKEVWVDGGLESLSKKISNMYIRRTLKDTDIKLPPQDIIVHEIEINSENYPKQFELLDTLWNDALLRIEDGTAETVTSVLALITRQRQATVWPGGINLKVPRFDLSGKPEFGMDGKQLFNTMKVDASYHESAKIDAAVELYNDLVADGHRVVFFSQFKEVLYELKRRLGDSVVEFHGDVSNADREVIKRNFDASVGEEKKWDGILCHYRPGGIGLNLTAATAMIIMDEEWNPGKESQAFDRINRIGQTKETQVHILRHVGPGRSMDKWLKDIIEMKRSLTDQFQLTMEVVSNAFA